MGRAVSGIDISGLYKTEQVDPVEAIMVSVGSMVITGMPEDVAQNSIGTPLSVWMKHSEISTKAYYQYFRTLHDEEKKKLAPFLVLIVERHNNLCEVLADHAEAHDSVDQLEGNGITLSKVEIPLGGDFNSIPEEYREDFEVHTPQFFEKEEKEKKKK